VKFGEREHFRFPMLSCWWSSGRGCWRWMSFRVLPRQRAKNRNGREDASQHDSYCWSLKIHWFHITLPFFLDFFLILQLKMSLTWADRLLRSFSSSSPYDKRVKTQLVADVPGMPRHISYGTSRWLSWKTATDMRIQKVKTSEVKDIRTFTS